MPTCPRCDGSMLNDRGEVRCLSCGWLPGASVAGSRSEQAYTPRKSKVTEADVADWRALRAQGLGYLEIAAQTGRGRSTISKRLRGMGRGPRVELPLGHSPHPQTGLDGYDAPLGISHYPRTEIHAPVLHLAIPYLP